MVFALDNEIVMKIPKNNFGRQQNKIEYYIYENVETHFKKYLCPVIDFQPELLIAKRAIPINDDMEYLSSLRIFCGNIIFYQDILDLSKRYYLSKDDIRATSSWGILNGDKVLIDYGCPSRQGYKYYKKVIKDFDESRNS